MNAQTRLERPLALLAAVALGALAAACDAFNASSPVRPSAADAVNVTQQPGSSPSLEQQLAAVRRATSRYQNIDAAFADGYEDDGFGCIDALSFGLDASEGGMGLHLINWSLHNDISSDAERPDLLVYQPAPGPNAKPKLVALEYEVFTADWFAAGHTAPPQILGQDFKRLTLPDFDFDGFELHLWLWRDNPAGLFSDFNPSVPLCR